MNLIKGREKFKAPIRLTAAALSFFLGLAVGIQAREVVTNETIEKVLGNMVAFRKSHGVMWESQERMHSISDAFLSGDLASIKKFGSEISNSLGKVTNFLPKDDSEARTKGWQSIAEVSNQAKEIEKSANAEDFVGAYNHYAQLMFQCVKCHQEVRSWGGFPIQKPKEPEKSETKPKDKSAPPTA